MINEELDVFLKQIIENFYKIFNFPKTGNIEEYELLLFNTIDNLIKLINYDKKKKIDLIISVEVKEFSLSPINFFCYSNDLISSITNKQFEIQKVLEKKSNLNYHSLFDLYVNLLKGHSLLSSNFEIDFFQEYLFIQKKICQLIKFFIDFHFESEFQLVKFIYECFKFDLKIYSEFENELNFKFKLKEDQKNNVMALKKYIEKNYRLFDKKLNFDIIKSEIYFDNNLNIDNFQIKFKSNHEDLNQLYKLFLNMLCLYEIIPDNFKKYISIMISIYKSHNSIDFIEINSIDCKKKKIDQFHNFFFNNSINTSFSMLSPYYVFLNDKVISYIMSFPNLKLKKKKINKKFSLVKKKSFINETNQSSLYLSRYIYSKEDQNSLFLNLLHFIPLLNEFDLNFNLHFPFIFKSYLNLLHHDNISIAVPFDYKYVEEIVNLLNLIVDFENDEKNLDDINIKSIISSFNTLHNYLFLQSSDNNCLTLLMKIVFFDYKKNHYIKKKIISTWNYKFYKLGELEYNSNKFLKLKSKLKIKKKIVTKMV